ncbi:MAG TPA: ATP-binding protein, partial [Candidatus Saccharimonadales bacterium]|nr:ATP-binding protein [Candidatus Saccharimonadales bacterium]
MAEEASPKAGGHGAGLRLRLVLFGTLLAAFVVMAAFLSVSIQIRANTRRLLAEELSESQRLALEQNRRTREQLLRTSGLVTNNSTLRAAIETYRLETGYEKLPRPDLIATIQHEVSKIATALDNDLLIVTDDEGKVLAASERTGSRIEPGESLASQPVVKHALNQDGPVGEGNFAVLELDGTPFQVTCVPIVLQGYIIGTLTHGDRIDDALVTGLQDYLGGEIVITMGDRPVASTLPPGAFPAGVLPETSGPPDGPDAAPRTLSLGGEEFVEASASLGSGAGGRAVRLHLLHSLTGRLREANRSMVLIFLAYGSAAVLLAGLLAALVSRSILRPLQEFVAFMRSVARSGDPSSRFAGRPGSPEVATLNEAYDQMMDSLERTREQLSGAREDLVRLERLKEAEKMAALGRMLSGAAHEINNPLSAVVGNIELLMSAEPVDDHWSQRLQNALREGRRVAALVKNLLKLSRRSEEQRRSLDLNSVIRESLSVCRHDFANSGIEVHEELAHDEMTIFGNELELQQIFLNLFRNAYDELKTMGRPGAIEIRSARKNGEVIVDVADNGPGIRDLERLFEPFFTTKEIGKGTGLGLSICLGIVEAHGGRLTAANRSEGGARFTLALPAHRPERT